MIGEIPDNAPLVAAMDDTLFKKTGKKAYGVAYRRDPLGPHFHTNFILGQRFVQISAALCQQLVETPAKMVPVLLKHAPTPQKPKKSAPENEWKEYNRQKKVTNLSKIGLQAIGHIRAEMDSRDHLKNRPLVISVDGSYTNETILKNLPIHTVLIGRIRKDAKLHYLPDQSLRRGRKKKYGEPAQTPDEIRRDDTIPYQTIPAFAAGKIHHFRIKTIGPLRWRKAGGDQNLRLVIIAPLAYRLTKSSRLLYRQPAYLICTDPDLPIEKLLQFYLWRWGIEVNFRDQKTILGTGQAQVRNKAAVENIPALITAAYATLLIAAKRTFGQQDSYDNYLPPPKWHNARKNQLSTQKIINHLKTELWGASLGLRNFSHFVDKNAFKRTHRNWRPNIASAVLYANQ